MEILLYSFTNFLNVQPSVKSIRLGVKLKAFILKNPNLFSFFKRISVNNILYLLECSLFRFSLAPERRDKSMQSRIWQSYNVDLMSRDR